MIMKGKNMKGIANAIIVIVLLGMLGIKLYSAMDADSTRVAELVDKAAQNEESRNLVAKFLSETPVPTNGEVIHISSEVERMLVEEISHKAVANAGLKPVSKPTGSEANDIDTPLNRILFGLLALAFALAIFRTYRRMEAGDY